jgi:Tfp pilus assembly PilM family ATPase
MTTNEVRDIVSLQFHNNEIVISNLQKIADNDFLLKKITTKELSQPFLIEKVTDIEYCELFFQELKDFFDSEDMNAEELVFCFGDQAAILKNVEIDKNADAQLIYDQLEWEFKQISPMKVENYHFAIPDIESASNQKLMIALNKALLEFSKDLASNLNLKLSLVTLNSLSFVHLLDIQKQLEMKRLILVLIEDSYVEIGLYYKKMLQQNQFIDFSNGININTLNIHIRKMIDLIGVNNSDSHGFDMVYITGKQADNALAQSIANAVQVSVELLKPLKNVNLAPDIETLNESEESKYAISISAALQL